MSALFWILAGCAMLLVTLGYMKFGGMWAVLLFIIGANIAWKALRPVANPGDPSAALDLLQFMGGTKTVITTADFKGGQATAVMGGCEIDLRRAKIAGGEAVFDAFAMWGGVEIKVPEDWAVENRGMGLLGGFVDSTRRPAEPKGRLVLSGLAIMGGVEAKN